MKLFSSQFLFIRQSGCLTLICAWSCSVLSFWSSDKVVVLLWSVHEAVQFSVSGHQTKWLSYFDLCMKLFSSQFLVIRQSGCLTLICAWSCSVLSFWSSDKVVVLLWSVHEAVQFSVSSHQTKRVLLLSIAKHAALGFLKCHSQIARYFKWYSDCFIMILICP